MNNARVEEVIICDLKLEGNCNGNTANPARIVTQVFSKSGEIIATNDPYGNFTIDDIARFGWLVRAPENKDKDTEDLLYKFLYKNLSNY